jgi:YHS domain-containing protein
MKQAILAVAVGAFLILAGSAQPADQAPVANPHAGHAMPGQGGEGTGGQPQGVDPHAGHAMPMQGGKGMMGGRMQQMMMNCSMHAQMGQVVALMKDVVAMQEALLKGPSGSEKDGLQVKMAEMRKAVDSLQSQPMRCPMMQNMQHGQHGASGSTTPAAGQVSQAFAKDPTCGMDVDVAEAKAAGLTYEYQGKTYYFCSVYCKEQFAKNPKP